MKGQLLMDEETVGSQGETTVKGVVGKRGKEEACKVKKKRK
jgi:hypothetical protein